MKAPIVVKLEKIIDPMLQDMGFELVRVMLTTSARSLLQIMAERPDGTMTIEDCEQISRAVSARLDVENPLEGAYTLEVSSPGIDRPLTRLKDFETYAGFEAKVEVDPAVDGRKRFKGILAGQKDGQISLKTEEGVVTLPFADVQRAKLTLNDDIIKASQQRKA